MGERGGERGKGLLHTVKQKKQEPLEGMIRQRCADVRRRRRREKNMDQWPTWDAHGLVTGYGNEPELYTPHTCKIDFGQTSKPIGSKNL